VIIFCLFIMHLSVCDRRVFVRVYQVEELQENLCTPMVVCLGVFDGVHLGHRRLINEAIDIARDNGMETLVHTYDPLPANVISPRKPVCDLTPIGMRLRLLEEAGVQNAAVSKFTLELQHLRGSDFFMRILLGKLNAKHIVAGFNHHFGFKADTDVDRLQKLCREAKIGLSIIPPVQTPEGKLICSTAIRTLILDNDLEGAARMLGRPVDTELLKCMRTPVHPPR
jgi:riboflavin kinase/FMN adenylyltransferase